ncbi:DUF3087 family protein [Halopseudomonas salegens]|uniref:DUF3087 domain-containing protein n=1 Tax=Halopseudomonas salegens TaxID=1434072 RepID=A0A1H2H366_9GAMM|nr:DUF3087 family protein [Halopseudomonas salegens]SDU26301.1 Protein of unknown function [Halopseudomonas salegens]
MFVIEQRDPLSYRRDTRQSTIRLIVLFAVLGMLMSMGLVALFGQPGMSNFRWNLLGVLLALMLTVILVRQVFWQQPWMGSAAYGWQLKRCMLRITNCQHQLKAGVTAQHPAAMKLQRFYHLGLSEMYRLDGNQEALDTLAADKLAHEQALHELGLPVDLYQLDPAWLHEVQQIKAPR